jgi:hypothetical protein
MAFNTCRQRIVLSEDLQFIRRLGVLVAIPEVVLPYVVAEIEVCVEPEILQFVDTPPPLCTSYGVDSDCSTFNVTPNGWLGGANSAGSGAGFTSNVLKL